MKKLMRALADCRSTQTGCEDVPSGTPCLHAGFDGQQWYQQLYDYGMGASFGPGDPDEELIPRLVKELVLPLAQHALANVWNPASRRQSRAAAAMLADLLVYVPPDDKRMQVGPSRVTRSSVDSSHRLCQTRAFSNEANTEASRGGNLLEG